MAKNAFKKASIASYLKADGEMAKVLTTKDLVGLGIGTVIGTGIFSLPGIQAATNAGPAVALAFLLGAIFSGIAGMAFAEFSAAMPVAGTAYSFGSVISGELVGWLLGWGLILEYFLAVSAIAVGFSGYFQGWIGQFGLELPQAIAAGPAEGGLINLPALVIILLVALILAQGLQTSRVYENAMVVLKVLVIVLFILAGGYAILTNGTTYTSNWTPFYPQEFHSGLFGGGGIFAAAAGVFFAFVGFDTLAAHTAETKDPEKNMFRGIIYTVIIAGVLYVLFALVLTGLVNYKDLNVTNPTQVALEVAGMPLFNQLISLGAMLGMASAIQAMMFGSSRLAYAFGRDGLLPKALGKLSGPDRTPNLALLVAVIIEGFVAAFVPFSTLGDLVSAGTLLAFVFVNFGIFALRRRTDIVNNGFKMPWYPVLPLIGGVGSAFFMLQLDSATLTHFGTWLILGVVVYFVYGIHHSKLQQGAHD
jgi:APA family basic amino acid/polyamine antiporter